MPDNNGRWVNENGAGDPYVNWQAYLFWPT